MSNMLRINKRTLFIVILLSFVIICFTSITVSAYFRGNDSRKEFFNKIIEVVTLLGGDTSNVI